MRALFLTGALLLAGCLVVTEPAQDADPALAGDWTLQMTLTGPLRLLPDGAWRTLTCTGAPKVHLDVRGDSLVGRILGGPASDLWCESDTGGEWFSWDGWLVGTEAGDVVTLDDGYCLYTGTPKGGDITCLRNTGAVELAMTGTWEVR